MVAIHPIDPDVRRIARRFAGSSPALPKLVQAVIRAEGGTLDHLLKAVRCSMPETADANAAIDVCCRSAVHAMSDYLMAHDHEGFVAYFASKWAPVGVANDPTNLNKNWTGNVLAGLK